MQTQQRTTTAGPEQGIPQAGKSQADKLRAVAEGAYLFHTPTGDAYADIPGEHVIETTPIRSRAFKDWLTVTYEDTYGGGFSKNALDETINSLEARARRKGEEHAVFIRVGFHQDTLYLDMCDPARQVIQIMPSGWTIIPASEAPVRFRRTAQMLASPLPVPVGGGSVWELFDHINVPDWDGQILIVGYLMNLLHPSGPYAGLTLYGEQGSAKTTAARRIRSLIDPTDTPVTGEPKDADTVALQANANWTPAFDNIRYVSNWLADALCRLATGAGYNKRTLYADTDLTVIKVKRPFILTSITDAITQPDLLDRTLVVRLPVITETARKDEATLDQAFEEARPRILGALLDAATEALARYEEIELGKLPRMADLAKWVTAAEPELGLEQGTFVSVYAENKVDAYQAAIDSNPVAQAIVTLMQGRAEWSGTATRLEDELKGIVLDRLTMRLPTGWPRTAKGVSDRLKEAAPALRANHGIDMERERSGDRARERLIVLRRLVDEVDAA